VQVDPVALELELVDLALVVLLAAGLEGEDLQVAERCRSPASSSRTVILLSVACQALYVVVCAGSPWLDRCEGGNRLPFLRRQ
jgi:hypothetical protein